jgi:hypothetical protein
MALDSATSDTGHHEGEDLTSAGLVFNAGDAKNGYN